MILTSVGFSADELQNLGNPFDSTGDQLVRLPPRGPGEAAHVAHCCICPPPITGLI